MSDSSTLNLSVILRAVDRLSGPINNINARLDALHGPVRRLGAALNNSLRLTGISQITSGLIGVGSEVSRLVFKLTALGGVAGFAFKRLFIDTAAEFENYKITLETFYGTSEKAQGALDWVSKFAALTPYQLGEVTRGFIELKSFGLDPTGGALKAAGDAAAAMGKPFDMATNTLASAMRGQAEMLDNFGIFGRIEKDMMVFDWVDKAGKKFHKEVDKTNRDLIAKTIQGIWEQKFGGSMDRLSQGYTGMVSNIMDNFTRLANKVMESGGAFSFLKDELQKVLDTLNYLQTPEGLKETEEWGRKLRKVLGEIKLFAKDAWKSINELADKVGGFGNLAELVFGSIAAIMAGPLLLSILTGIGGVAMLSSALLALAVSNPILLMLEAATIAIIYLINNWDAAVAGVTTGVSDIADWLGNALMGAINGVIDGIKLAFSGIIDGVAGVIRAIKNIATFKNPFSGGDPMFPMPEAPASAPAASLGLSNPVVLPFLSAPVKSPTLGKPLTLVSSKSPADSKMKIDTGGELHLKIDSPMPVTVLSMKANDPRQTINVDSGPTMVHAR